MSRPRRVEIAFERGGKFVMTLLEEEAPASCKALLEQLPLQGLEVRHARFGGQEFYTHISGMDAPKENAVERFAGDVAFNPAPDWRALIVFYGPELLKYPGQRFFNKIARVTDDLDKLMEVGNRIWLRGTETVSLRLLPE